MIDAFYINLDTATERRRSIEASWAACNFKKGWTLNRFEAVKANSPEVQAIPGNCPAPFKGNWQSHVGVIRQALERGLTSDILVVEDDTIFCDSTQAWVDGITAYLPREDWDILYLDVFISNAIDMPWFLKLRHQCFRESRVEVIDLKGYPRAFAGAGAYVVNNRALRKFLQLADLDSIHTCFDLYLKHLVRLGVLNGFLTFPFLTTVAELADDTQVPHPAQRFAQDRLMNAFRRLVWMGAGEPDTRPVDDNTVVTNDVKKLQDIVAPLLSLQLGWHY